MSAWTVADVPDQTGRTALVTGASSGLGLATARVLAQRGARVLLVSRASARADAAFVAVRAAAPRAAVEHRPVDLADLGSVRELADSVLADRTGVDLLVNNAGIMAPPRRLSAQGIESQLAVNHVAHAALTGLLLPCLRDGARVVTVSSSAHHMASVDFDDPASERSYSRASAYGRSKLANLLFAFELDRRLRAVGAPVLSVAAHPGVASSDLTRQVGLPGRVLWAVTRPFIGQSATAGARSQLRAATDPAARGGEYYGPTGLTGMRGAPGLVEASAQARDAQLAGALWELTERWTGVVVDPATVGRALDG